MHTHFATNAIRYVGTVPLRVAGGESGEVVEEDVIRGVTYSEGFCVGNQRGYAHERTMTQ